MAVTVLGISAFYHDSAAALLRDGEIVAAAQEERFTRVKQDERFPEHAVRWCLASQGLDLGQIDHVVFYEKPFIKFERLVETYVNFAPAGFSSFRRAMPLWLKQKLFQKRLLVNAFKDIDPEAEISGKLLFAEHHESHAASAFFPSPFEEAVVLTVDGVGEWATTSLSIGRGNTLVPVREIRFPHSLGLLYSAFAYYCGFKVNSGEYKLMGLAPYGRPVFKTRILETLLRLGDDGSYWLDQSYFNYATGLTMTNARFEALFGRQRRDPENELLDDFHMDMAASIQAVLEEALLRIAAAARAEFGLPNLVMAGGVALNCVANSALKRMSGFERIWVQPAAGDAGGALGAALAAWHGHLKHPRRAGPADAMRGAYLGPAFTQGEIERELVASGAKFTVLPDDELFGATVDALAGEKAVGWFQGAMEFGPRSLGARSILGDARSPTMQKTLNLRVKYRESFRPFAPAVLREDVGDWFEWDEDSPYMLFTMDVRPERRREMSPGDAAKFGIDKLNVVRSDIPAVTHVDYSARVQTVHAETNPKFARLLREFKAKTGCPVLVNTSFNVRGEPIVCTPADAFRCFMGTDIEVLVVGNCFLVKEDQDPALKLNYETAFALD